MRNDPEIAEFSYPTLLILATPVALALPQAVAARILYGTGRLRWFARAVMAEALVNLLLSLALVRPFGIQGVALGTAIPNIIGSSALVIYICRMVGVGAGGYLRYTFFAPVAALLPLAAAWLAAARWLDLTSWMSLVATGALGLGAYLLVGAFVEVGPRGVFRSLTKHVRPRAAGDRSREASEVGQPRSLEARG
jgi:O-antigen/teichoic acid export membrane protein